MVSKVLFLGLIMVGVVVLICMVMPQDVIEDEVSEQQLYQGPVPQGYNLTHFSNTGEMILEDSNG